MSASHPTQHALRRMSQRGIRLDDLELAQRIGTEVEGGYLIRQRDFQAYERDKKKEIERARRLVGKRVVETGDILITGYHAKRAKERRLLRRQ